MRNRLIFSFLSLLSLSAIYGQTLYFHGSLDQPLTEGWSWLIPVAVSLAIEGISVYLTAMAHAAVMANQAGGSLRLGSYVLGIVMGALNYAHFAGASLQPNATAVTFGMLSSLSPWLWAIYSRHVHRVALARLGLTEPRGVRLSTARRIWHPIRSVAVYSYASWVGIQDPRVAVEAWMSATKMGRRTAEKLGAGIGVHPTGSGTDSHPTGSGSDTRSQPDSTATSGTDTGSATSGTSGSDTGSWKEMRREQYHRLRESHPKASKTQLAQMMGISPSGLRKALAG